MRARDPSLLQAAPPRVHLAVVAAAPLGSDRAGQDRRASGLGGGAGAAAGASGGAGAVRAGGAGCGADAGGERERDGAGGGAGAEGGGGWGYGGVEVAVGSREGMGMGMAWCGVEMIRESLEMCWVENVAPRVEKLYGLSDKSKIPKI